MKRNTFVLSAVTTGFILLLYISCSSGQVSKTDFHIMRGINISHWLSQSDVRGSERESYFTYKDISYLASLGFDHLRIPIDEEQMFSENGEKDIEAFLLLHKAIESCISHDLKVIVDLHILRSHFFNAEIKPLFTEVSAQEQFYECWRQISSELNKYPETMVAYELMNEPVADDPEIWNRIAANCAAVIRKLEPGRILVIGSNRWQGYETVKDLKVPENDPNILISFHYYNPFFLTHYKAAWTDMKDYEGPVHYPGKLLHDDELGTLPDEQRKKYGWANSQSFNRSVMEAHFDEVLEVAHKYNLNVYCGEYGCLNTTPEEDRNRWYQDITRAFEEKGIARAAWDYKGGFGIIKKGQPDDELIKILLE